MLEQVISGGQNGVDQAALRAAKATPGLKTGGWAPRGFKTLAGSCPELGSKYGLIECLSDRYAIRTELNVIDGDATLRIARDFKSAGELCTLKYIRRHEKPYMDIKDSTLHEPNTLTNIYDWLGRHEVRVLNVAGNSELSAPGIHERTYNFLLRLFHHSKVRVL
jgi:hypothetical protein